MKIKLKNIDSHLQYKCKFAWLPIFVWGDLDKTHRYLIWLNPYVEENKWNKNHGFWETGSDYIPEALK